MDAKISKHTKDIIQKHANGLFKNATLEYYGIKTAKIKELISVEIPVVEVAETSMDFVLLLEDDTYLNLEFQSSHKESDLERFASYNLRLYQRDRRKIKTVIIYSANVKNIYTSILDMGDLVYNPHIIMMKDYDGNKIFAGLEEKLNNKEDLTDIDMLNLIFLPLMSHELPREEIATKSVQLAKNIEDTQKRNACIASVFAFASKYLEEENINNLLEVIKMTDLATLLLRDAIEESMEKGIEKGMEKGMEKGKQARDTEVAKSMLIDGLDVEFIRKYTGLSVKQIEKLKLEQ